MLGSNSSAAANSCTDGSVLLIGLSFFYPAVHKAINPGGWGGAPIQQPVFMSGRFSGILGTASSKPSWSTCI